MKKVNTHWTEAFYKELRDVEEYESSLAQAISPDSRSFDAIRLSKHSSAVSGAGHVERVNQTNPNLKSEMVQQQKSLEKAINCDFSVESFPVPTMKINQDTCSITRVEVQKEGVSKGSKIVPPNPNNQICPEPNGISILKVSSRQRNIQESKFKSDLKEKSSIQHSNLKKENQHEKSDVQISNLRKVRQHDFSKRNRENETSERSQEVATKSAMEMPIRREEFPTSPTVIEILKEKAEYRVIPVSKSSSEKVQEIGVPHTVADNVICSNQDSMNRGTDSEPHLPMIRHDEFPKVGETIEMAGVDFHSTCSSAEDDASISIPISSPFGISSTDTSDRYHIPVSSNMSTSPVKRLSSATLDEGQSDQSSVISLLSETSIHDGLCQDDDNAVESTSGNGVAASRNTHTFSPYCSKFSGDSYVSRDDNYSLFYGSGNFSYEPIHDEYPSITAFASERIRRSKLIDDIRKNVEITKTVLKGTSCLIQPAIKVMTDSASTVSSDPDRSQGPISSQFRCSE